MPRLRRRPAKKNIAIRREVPASFRISSSAGGGRPIMAAEKDDEGRLRSFSMLAYNGGRLHLDEFDFPVVVDLQGMKVPRKVLPILRQHDHDRPVGHTTRIDVGRSRIEIGGVLSAANDHAREIAESGGQGFPWESSIGARATDMIFVEEGESVRVNGQVFNGPIYVATESILKEVSFVVLGADEDGATATVAAQAAKEGAKMLNRFKAWLRAQGFNYGTLNAKQRQSLRRQFALEQEEDLTAGDGTTDITAEDRSDDEDEEDEDDVSASDEQEDDEEVAADDDSEDDDEDKAVAASARKTTIKAKSKSKSGRTNVAAATIEEIRATAANESRRIHKIKEICAKYPNVKIKGDPLEAYAINAGWSPDKTELYAMRKSRPTAPAGHVKRTDDAIHAQAIEAALLLSTSHSEEVVGKQYGEKVMNAALSKEYRGMTLHSLMGATIRAAGRHYHGSHKSNDFIREMKIADRELKASQGFSTLSVSNILENVANKSLIASYQAQETVWQEFCARKSYTDFKVQARYRLDAQGSFQKVGPDGELKHVGVTDAKYTNQLGTYGAIITLNREMMINDDLDAFLEIPKHLGQMSAIRVEEAFFVLLLGNAGSFFDASNKNLYSGADSAFSITALNEMEARFRNQVTPNGKPMLVSPKKLLVPTTLAVTAESIFAEKLLITGEEKTLTANNPHAGKYKPYTSPYINNTAITDQDGKAITGQSNTQWYLFADPAVRAAVVMGFLNGQDTPTIESDDTTFDTLGMSWRAYHDFGCGFEDPCAAQKAVGS